MNEIQLQQGILALADIDKDVASALEEYGFPPPRNIPAGFESLLSIIVSQQISTEASKAIMGRVRDLTPVLTAEAFLALEPDAIRGAGLSRPKVKYSLSLAEAIVERRFEPDALIEMDDSSAIKAITELKGFGQWSAEIYLMFALGRCDIFPADDLALQVALGRLKGFAEKPTAKQTREIVNTWTPWRTAGALFLWHYYRGAPA
ncbi:DNA-3-methyladenine glycosylase [Photobacterium jeanii]|uniref:DNA-3-methyladenine glycosylase II n=2 Tax=Photobacterium jeanii TaxID=858640 RepID=A0A178K3N4_9GAMM|nr:DNA-3-methyladenine glycosylase [Photobacterium jeanii]PST91253.1 DNA-3-methyladenine glycosylase 2 family protein [Photobacterium jeanii]